MERSDTRIFGKDDAMACDHPNIGIFKRDANCDRVLVKMIQYASDKAIDDYSSAFNNCFTSKDDVGTKYVHFKGSAYEAILLPCGRCIGCRLEYSRQWAMRCTLEALQFECNYFLTFTYDDAHLPKNPYKFIVDSMTGEVTHDGHSSPLIPKHIQDFLKRLRRYYERVFNHQGIRFFLSGEYGDKSGRPHFHMILFNCPIPDLQFYKTNFQGHPLFNSRIFDKLWNNGYTVIAECNFDTCAYVARYIMKKQTGKNAGYYDSLDLTPEFSRMSRRPGIGRFYYDQNSDKIYSADQVTILGADGKAISPCPPKYFDALYSDEDPERFQEIKNNRNVRTALKERSSELLTGLSKSTKIHIEERSRDRAIIALKRVN